MAAKRNDNGGGIIEKLAENIGNGGARLAKAGES
jgi:hypothetical protein